MQNPWIVWRRKFAALSGWIEIVDAWKLSDVMYNIISSKYAFYMIKTRNGCWLKNINTKIAEIDAKKTWESLNIIVITLCDITKFLNILSSTKCN